MRNGTPLLVGIGAALTLLCADASEIVTVPVTLTLDAPAGVAPGINNMKVDFAVPIIGTETDNSTLTGTIDAIFQLNVDDPTNPVVVGIQYSSADIAFEDTYFHFVAPSFSVDVTVTGIGVGASIATPSGKPEPVAGNSFDATLHELNMNEGKLIATGTAGGNPIDGTRDLAVDPLTSPGSGTGTTSVATLPGTPISFNYQLGASLPVVLQQPIDVDGVTVTVTVAGTIAGTGQANVVILPKLRALGFAVGGFELEATGQAGASVLLKWSDNLDGGGWNTIGTVTLPMPLITDADAIGKPLRFYRFEQP